MCLPSYTRHTHTCMYLYIYDHICTCMYTYTYNIICTYQHVFVYVFTHAYSYHWGSNLFLKLMLPDFTDNFGGPTAGAVLRLREIRFYPRTMRVLSLPQGGGPQDSDSLVNIND